MQKKTYALLSDKIAIDPCQSTPKEVEREPQPLLSVTFKSVSCVGNCCLIPICSLSYYYLMAWKFLLLFFSLKINMNQIFYMGPRPVMGVMSLSDWCTKVQICIDEVYLLKRPLLFVCSIYLGVLKEALDKALRRISGCSCTQMHGRSTEKIFSRGQNNKNFTDNFRKSEDFCKGLEQHSINMKHFSKH